ncbi:hypothetical protein MVEN_01112800 [Mycena venus]|uniref:Uncharacterized protein n=1 Tax=Mycena venus TaxID=2733690 RepID=A0A8H6Y6N8_9AGAR|nr:hypothetical protein MVEN_01112800 [Mycena venus]
MPPARNVENASGNVTVNYPACRTHLCEYRALPGHVYEPIEVPHRRRCQEAEVAHSIQSTSPPKSVQRPPQIHDPMPLISRRQYTPSDGGESHFSHQPACPSHPIYPILTAPITAEELRSLDDYFALFDKFDNFGVSESFRTCDNYSSASSDDGLNLRMDFWAGFDETSYAM